MAVMHVQVLNAVPTLEFGREEPIIWHRSFLVLPFEISWLLSWTFPNLWSSGSSYASGICVD